MKRMLQELIDFASKTEGQGRVVGLGIRSEEIEGSRTILCGDP